MNHTIKGIILVVAITSMLIVGATTVPIMQNSFAHKKSDFKKESDPNTNINTNSADSSSSSDATADNTNNINNKATASQSQEQSACAVAVTCPEGSTSIHLVLCPHPPYSSFVLGIGCQDGEPQTTCNPPNVAGLIATPTDGTCTATLPLPAPVPQFEEFVSGCQFIPGSSFENIGALLTCIFPSTQTCPTPTGSTQTPTVVNGRCTIQPGPT